jgi:hypothetical protein
MHKTRHDNPQKNLSKECNPTNREATIENPHGSLLPSLGVLRDFQRRDELLGFSQLRLLARGQNSLPAELEHHLLGVPKGIRLYIYLQVIDIFMIPENRALKLFSRVVLCVESLYGLLDNE